MYSFSVSSKLREKPTTFRCCFWKRRYEATRRYDATRAKFDQLFVLLLECLDWSSIGNSGLL